MVAGQGYEAAYATVPNGSHNLVITVRSRVVNGHLVLPAM